MERLTEDLIGCYGKAEQYIDCDDRAWVGAVINKLGILEDLSEKIGCPLEICIKATLGRFWVEDEQKWHSLQDSLIIKTSNGEYAWCIGHDMSDYRIILLKDYKKTWWLKADKSE